MVWPLSRAAGRPPRRPVALAGAAPHRLARPCKICGAGAPPFDVVDFNKFCSEADPYRFGLSGIPVTYHRCGRCGFLFTGHFDAWTTADFARHVYNDDYLKVDPEYRADRPGREAALFAERLPGYRDAAILDYGSGTGAFADALAATGYRRVTNYDPFVSPERPKGRFDIVTCFEVIEHTTDPVAVLRDMASMLAEGGIILFSTGLQPADIGRIRANWWYVGPRNGHVSIFSGDTLAMLGQAVGLHLCWGSGWGAYRQAVAPDAPTGALARAAGEPALAYILTAPGGRGGAATVSADSEGWAAPEADAAGPYRRPAGAGVTWRIPAPVPKTCHLKLIVPLGGGHDAGAGARLTLAGQDLCVQAEAGNLTVALRLDRPFDGRVTLEGSGPDWGVRA